MRIRILVTLLTLASSPALTQKVAFGPLAGVASSTWRGADVHPEPGYRSGFVFGGFVSRRMYKSLGLEADVFYVRKGMHDGTLSCPDPGSYCPPYVAMYTEDFVEIPLLVTVSTPIKFAPAIFAGAAVAFQTSCTFGKSEPLVEPCDSIFSGNPGSGSQPPTPSMKRNDALLVVGGAFSLGPFTLQARYDLGLTKFVVFHGTTLDYQTRAWLITAGYGFP